MLCRQKKEEGQTLLTCTSIVECLSKMAPRLRAEGDGVMLLSSIIIALVLERGPMHATASPTFEKCSVTTEDG